MTPLSTTVLRRWLSKWGRRLWLPALLAWAATVWLGSEKFLKPNRIVLEERHVRAIADPAEYGFSLTRFAAEMADGVPLDAWLIEPEENPGAAVKTRRMRERLAASGKVAVPPPGSARGTVLFLHGRGGLKENAFPVAERFVAGGWRCVAYDSRAHGKSGGEFSTYGVLEKDDVRRVLDGAEARFGGRLRPWVIFGNSLGAAVALQAIPTEPRLRAGVVVSLFAELPELTTRAAKNVLGGWAPGWLADASTRLGGWRGGFDPWAIRPVEDAASIRIPMMVCHGELDRVIPVEHGRRVFAALPEGGTKVWRPVPGAYHYNVLATGGDDLYQDIVEFWGRAVAPP